MGHNFDNEADSGNKTYIKIESIIVWLQERKVKLASTNIMILSIQIKINTNSNSCSNKKSKIRQSPTFSITVDVAKRNFVDNLLYP